MLKFNELGCTHFSPDREIGCWLDDAAADVVNQFAMQ